MLLTEKEKNEYAEENFNLIYFAAKMFMNTRIDPDELASVATVGFAKALNAYDKSKNVRFSTYSVYCMRNEILFFLRKEKKHTANNTSMNFVLSTDKNGNELNMEDIVSSQVLDIPSVSEKVELSESVSLLYKGLEHLTENERYIAIYRFGLDNGIQKTQREIAEDIGMSQANVSKIEKNLLVKLKDILRDDYNLIWRDKDDPIMQEEEV